MMRKRSEEREQAFCLLFQSLFNTDENFEIYEENIESVGDYARSIALGVEEKKENLDGLIEKYSKGWKVKRLPKVTLQYSGLPHMRFFLLTMFPKALQSTRQWNLQRNIRVSRIILSLTEFSAHSLRAR